MLTKTLSIALFASALTMPSVAQDAAYGGPKNVPEFAPAFENQTRAPIMQSDVALRVEEVAAGLVHPWGIAVLPGGGYLVTEREGRLRHITAEGELVDTAIEGVPRSPQQAARWLTRC